MSAIGPCWQFKWAQDWGFFEPNVYGMYNFWCICGKIIWSHKHAYWQNGKMVKNSEKHMYDTWYIIEMISCNCELSLWHNLGSNMFLQLLLELIQNLNKCFNHHETPIAISILSHNHTIYLIINCFELILCFTWLEKLFYLYWTFPFYYFVNSKHPCYSLNTITRPMLLNTTNYGVYFYPHPSRDFSPLNMQQRF